MRINTEICDTLTEDRNFNSMKTLFEDRFDSKNDVENQCLKDLNIHKTMIGNVILVNYLLFKT